MILVSITIFFTDLGKLGYWNEALLEAISMLNFGTVVSEYKPLAKPATVKSPLVFTLSKLAAYCAGINPKKFLNDEVGVLNFKSYSCPASTIWINPSNSKGNSLIFALFSLKVYLLFSKSIPKIASNESATLFM